VSRNWPLTVRCGQKSAWSIIRQPLEFKLEINLLSVTHNRVIGFRMLIALFMGLVLQLSQAESFCSGDVAPACGSQKHSMSCCEGLKSCPCAKSGDSDQKPKPLAPAPVDLKWIIQKTSEGQPFDVCISPPDLTQISVASPNESHRGFLGVSLSVAFCRFII
jgi:hypothetical protein